MLILVIHQDISNGLTYDNYIDEKISYRLISKSGRVVVVASLNGERDPHIDVSDLNTGIYFFNYKNDEGNESTYRFVKSNIND